MSDWKFNPEGFLIDFGEITTTRFAADTANTKLEEFYLRIGKYKIGNTSHGVCFSKDDDEAMWVDEVTMDKIWKGHF